MTLLKTILIVVMCGMCISCATPRGEPGALEDIKPGERPDLATDEAGLWMVVDNVEKILKTSGRRVTDPHINQYVRDIVCKLAGSYCPDIRIYIMQVPQFNASMAPNGTMQVWTGLILRAQNEAQLAYVLGHEIGHYLRRHSIQRWRDVQMKANLSVLFQIATAAAGVGYAGQLGHLALIGSIQAFSRDNEREADDVGFELMAQAGYDTREAPKIWESLMKEQEASERETPSIFFATHPPTEERIETLTAKAKEAVSQGGNFFVGKKELEAVALPLRATLLRDELRRGEFKETQVLLDKLMEGGVGLGQLHFFQGELHRLRAEPDDQEKAVVAYQKALEFPNAPPEAHRALGLFYFKAGEKPKAREALEGYLDLKPDGADHEMIREYLRQLN